MRCIDITRLIEPGGMVYPGDAPIAFAAGPDGRPLAFSAPCHCLTHVDAPYHFIDGGARIDQIAPERWMAEAVVVTAAGDAIGPGDVPSAEAITGKAVLFKTRHSAPGAPARHEADHAHLAAEAARALVDRGAAMVGIDSLNVDRDDDDTYPVHHLLLGADVLILEGLDLSAAEPGHYRLIALPLKLAGADGAPVRAVLTPLD